MLVIVDAKVTHTAPTLFLGYYDSMRVQRQNDRSNSVQCVKTVSEVLSLDW